MKVIIVAAGLGSRLNPLTNNKPKGLLKIKGKSILERQLEILRQCGVRDISIVRGYKGEKINFHGVKYYENPDYANNGILHSLFCAENEMDDMFIFSYSDIVYTKDVINSLLKNEEDISLVVDVDWRKNYVGRKKHPVSEAELVEVKKDRIVKIGKEVVNAKKAYGEFIGLAKFSRKGTKIFVQEFNRLRKTYKGKRNKPFQNAKEFVKAYFTDMVQELIDREHPVFCVDITGSWMEIDTDEDLKRAEMNWGNKEVRLYDQ